MKVNINNYRLEYKLIDLNEYFTNNNININEITELELFCCYYVEKIPEELIRLEKLTINTNLYIKYIPGDLICLKEIRLKDCNITDISEDLINLSSISISNCKYITEISDKFYNLNYLNIDNNIKISLENYNNLKNLILTSFDIKELTNNLYYLERLDLNNCPNITKLPNNLHYLKILNLCNCKNIKLYDDNYLYKLQELSLSYCNKITQIPNNLKTLKKLVIDNCYNIFILPSFEELLELNLNYTNINYIPHKLINLKKLNINYNNYIKNLPNDLINLEELYLKYMNISNIFNVDNSINLNLKKLFIFNCNNINYITYITNVNVLYIKDCKYIENIYLNNYNEINDYLLHQ